MHIAVYLPLVIPLLAAAAARPLAERLPPRTAAWLLAGSAIVLAAASCAVLGLLALAAAVRLPLVDTIGRLSLRAVLRHDPASLPVGVAAGAGCCCSRRPSRWSRSPGFPPWRPLATCTA